MPVSVGPHIVTKTGQPGLEAEAAKLRAYHRAGADEFEVPQVLNIDPVTQTLSMTRLPTFEPLVTYYLTNRTESSHVFWLAGVSLARIHAISGVEQAWVQALSLSRRGDSTTGPILLHGDYGFSNIGIIRTHGALRLVIFDPSPDRINVTSPSERGQPIDDMAMMMSCILGRVRLREVRHLAQIPRAELAHSFFNGYREINPPGCTLTEAIERGRELLSVYLTVARHIPTWLAKAAARLGSVGMSTPESQV